MSAPATSAGKTGAPRPLGPWRVVVLPVAAVALALLGIWFSGAALPTLLRDPGPVVRWGLPASSTLSELAGSVTLGALFLAIGILPRVTAGDRPVRNARAGIGTADGSAYPRSLLVAGFAAGAWTVLSIVHLVLTYADVAGQPVSSGGFGAQLGVFVTEIDLGRTLLLITTVAAVVTALSLVVATPTGAAWTGALVLVALYQQAQLGHASGRVGAQHRDLVDGGAPRRGRPVDRCARGPRPAGHPHRHRPVHGGRAATPSSPAGASPRSGCRGWSTACCAPADGRT